MNCPVCKNAGVKNGKYKDRQRYICPNCKISYKAEIKGIRKEDEFEKYRKLAVKLKRIPVYSEVKGKIEVSRATLYLWQSRLKENGFEPLKEKKAKALKAHHKELYLKHVTKRLLRVKELVISQENRKP